MTLTHNKIEKFFIYKGSGIISDVHLPKLEPREWTQWGYQPHHLQPSSFTNSHPTYHTPFYSYTTMDNAIDTIGRQHGGLHDGQHDEWGQPRG